MLAHVSRQTPRDETPSLPILLKFPELHVQYTVSLFVVWGIFKTEIKTVYSGFW